jgi:hypothetical protein
MSQSLDIIRHILDENLIDAKKATEGYLNDILSVAIREQYKEVAPSLVEEKGGKGGMATTTNTMTAAPAAGAEAAAVQQGTSSPLITSQEMADEFLSNYLLDDGTLPENQIQSIIARAFATGATESGNPSLSFLLNALSNVSTEGPGDGGSVSDPISVAGRPEAGDPDGFGGIVGPRGGGSNPLNPLGRRERR